ncbi:fibrous sheath CABYR-binding protein-like isoform X2 [Lytechinus variegatus]|uniref:fibrous sheath CABYR-binding protein-like isoform X2 n=1 Tax=Lytechinus variegatus TaxID=7654 RepID=UPI001BB1DB1E|nr:fibrous sheath CABYR-binding protein-like isoform X2 [Lytechinus variegatus]
MADEIGMEADPRISVGGIEAETGESGDIQEPLHRPPPTIDDIEIPPPPPEEDVVPPPLEEQSPPPPVSGEQAPPPPLSEDTPAIKMPQEEDTPLPPPIHEDTPSGKPPQMESTPALTCGDHGDLEPIEVDEVPVAPEDQQVKDPQDVSEVHEVGVDQYLPTIDCGSPLPPYNDSGVDVPSMSTADASVLEGKELQSEIDEIQIEVPDDASNGIHNASTLPSKRSMGTTTPTANQHSKVTGYIEMSPEETKAEMTRVSTYRREAVMWVTIFLMLAGAIAVIFYFTFNIVNLSDASLPGK